MCVSAGQDKMPIYYKKISKTKNESNNILKKIRRNSFSSFSPLKFLNKEPNDTQLITIDFESPLISFKFTESRLNYYKDIIETKCGPLTIARQQDTYHPYKSSIITYHDIGLNHVSNFTSFFELRDNHPIIQTFNILHIIAPGQDGSRLTQDYQYPSLDELADQIQDVINYYHIKCFVGLGVGAGSNILTRFALKNSKSIQGLFLINPSCTQSSWFDWFFMKRVVRSLQFENNSNVLPLNAQQYLLWYHIGKEREEKDDSYQSTLELYREYYKGTSLNPRNLSLFMDSYLNRSAIDLSRSETGQTLKCQTLLISGAYSPHLEKMIIMNSKLDPKCTTWMKISDCGMVLEEKPCKVAEALRLFLQGLGYPLNGLQGSKPLFRGLSLPCLKERSQMNKSGKNANI